MSKNLVWAAVNYNLAEVKRLLDLRADPNTRNVNGWTDLMWAAVYGQPELIELLLDYGPIRT